jgi:hypothetical protein
MASQKLTDKSALAQQTAANDLLMVVDVSDTTGSADGTSKKIEAQNVIAVKTLTLSSAQLQALHTTPINVLGSPGAGFMHLVHSAYIIVNYGTTTESNRITLMLAYGTPAYSSNLIYNIGSFMRSVAANTGLQFTEFNTNDAMTQGTNQAVNIGVDFGISADFTAVLYTTYTTIAV